MNSDEANQARFLATSLNVPPEPSLPVPDVRGWLTAREAAVLEHLARGRHVLELGSYCGRSTIVMARVARRVTSVDWHGGDSGTGPANTFSEFLGNLVQFSVAPRVRVLRCRVEECTRGLYCAVEDGGLFNLVFVDTEHTRAAVMRDVTVAEPFAATDCVWAFHDYTHLAEVRVAVRRWARRRGLVVAEFVSDSGVGVVAPPSHELWRGSVDRTVDGATGGS